VEHGNPIDFIASLAAYGYRSRRCRGELTGRYDPEVLSLVFNYYLQDFTVVQG
jgi:hypothetical protein